MIPGDCSFLADHLRPLWRILFHSSSFFLGFVFAKPSFILVVLGET